jgi:hypothetical protein
MKRVGLALLVFFAAGAVGCAAAPRQVVPSQVAVSASYPLADPAPVAKHHRLHVQQQLRSLVATLPTDIPRDAQWGLKQIVSLDGGYDLLPYAGKTVTITGYVLKETYDGQPTNLWIVQYRERVVGAYVAQDATEIGKQLVPGLFGLEEFRPDR